MAVNPPLLLLLPVLLVTATGAAADQQAGGSSAASKKASQSSAATPDQLRRDIYGDPLPPGAIARLGTIRFRAPDEAQSLAFSPDGKTVVLNSRGGLFLFHGGSGKRIKRLGNFTFLYRPENGVVFSPDGKHLAARGDVASKGKTIQYKSAVRVWELAGDKEPRLYDAEHLIWIGWSAEGEPLAVCLEKDGVRLRQLRSGQSRHFKCPNLGAPVLFRPEDKLCVCAPAGLLAVPDDQSVIHVWDTATGKKRFVLEREKDRYLHGLAVSSDGRHLALLKRARAAAYDYVVQILDAANGRVLRTVAMDQRYLATLAFSPDGRTLATAGWDGVRFWDVASGRERSRSQGEGANTSMIAFSGDGRTLATLQNNSGMFHVWDVASGKRQPEPVGHAYRPYGMAFSPDGRRVASAGGLDGTIHVWDLATSKSLFSIQRPSHWVRRVAWSRDGHWLYSTWTDDALWISDAATGIRKHLIKLEDPNRPDTRQDAISMHLSADGKTLVAFSVGARRYDETLVTGWDPVPRKQLFRRRLPGMESVTAVSADARLLAASSPFDKGAGLAPMRLEELATGDPLLTFPSPEGQTWPLAFSPDSRLLAAYNSNYQRLKKDDPTSTASSLVLWEVATAREVLSLPLAGQPRAAFSPDGRLVAIPAPLRSILVWDLAQGDERRRFKEFDGQVTWLDFSPDGRRLFSAHADSALLIWDVPGPSSSRKDKLAPESVVRAWADLAGDEAPRAFRARWTLANAPDAALPLLASHLQPARPADAKRLRQLLADLDSPQFAVRTAAQKGLESLGVLAAPALRRTLAKNSSLELRRRVDALLNKLRGPVTDSEQRRAVRAVAVLEDTATPEARKHLAMLAQGAPEARLSQEARAALKRLRQQPP
jgi:WD40 repeat protein